MDTTLSRIRVYDLLGVFITGMVVLAVGVWLDLTPLMLIHTETDAVKIGLFVLYSIPAGILTHEIGSAFDHKILKAMDSAAAHFLDDHNPVAKDPLELRDFRKAADQILGREETDGPYNEDQTTYVYQKCRAVLEVYAKDEKGLYLYSLYNMSRNMTAALPLLTLLYLARSGSSADPWKILFLFISTCIFCRRTIRFAAYPIREILRHYCALTWKISDGS